LGDTEIGEAVSGFARGHVERTPGDPQRSDLLFETVEDEGGRAEGQQRPGNEDQSRCT
jgi:hypothetical protein